MKGLRSVRIVLSVIFLVAGTLYVLTAGGGNAITQMAAGAQIVPSMIASTMGVTLIWLVATLLLGRVYCSTVCPLGTLLDIFTALRKPLLRRMGRDPRFRYRHASRHRFDVLIVYLLCVVAGLVLIPALLEPWRTFSNIVAVVKPSAADAAWIRLGVGAGAGMVAGIVSLLLLAIYALLHGRRYCTDICPIGTLMGTLQPRTLMHIEIDPDCCSGCLKCEEVCKSQCVKATTRYVDNSRCVKCFDCISVCPDNAIRYQMNRNRRATPMLRMRQAGKQS